MHLIRFEIFPLFRINQYYWRSSILTSILSEIHFYSMAVLQKLVLAAFYKQQIEFWYALILNLKITKYTYSLYQNQIRCTVINGFLNAEGIDVKIEEFDPNPILCRAKLCKRSSGTRAPTSSTATSPATIQTRNSFSRCQSCTSM